MTVHRLLPLLALVALCLAAPPSTAQVRIPPDFQLEPAKDSPGPVTFSHERHKAKVDKCQACHTKVFKMKKGTTGPLTMAKMKAGEQCGACHDGKTEFGGVRPVSVEDTTKCEACHRK
ncbi:MAG TPA: c(7)-type cytochrome triheme domain-containing protein [Methylomirabilota bacterium]